MADFRLSGRVDVEANDAVQQLDRLESEVAQANVAFREQASAAAAAGRALEKLKADTMANAEAVAAARRELVAAEQAQLKMAAAAKAAQQALRDAQQAQGGLTQSAGAARAAMTNFGQQIGDVTQGLAMGVNPATIFAQQAGQVAFAVQGMGGAMAGVGRFLGGPWGILLTTAIVALSPLVGKLFEGAAGANELKKANEGLGEPIRDVAAATEILNKAQLNDKSKELAKDAKALAAERSAQAKATFDAARAEAVAALAAAQERADFAARGLRRTGRGAEKLDDSFRGRAGSELTREQFSAQAEVRAAQEALDKLDRAFSDAKTRIASQVAEASEKGTKAAARAAASAAQELAAENKRLTESYNPVLAAQDAYRAALDDIEKAERRSILSASAASKARVEAAQELRTALIKASAAERVPLSGNLQYGGPALAIPRISGAAEAANFVAALAQQPLPDVTKRWGGDIAREFAQGTNDLADQIGVGLAGGFGRGLRSASGVASFLERMQTGQGTAFMDSFRETVKGAFDKAFAGLQSVFKKIFGENSNVGGVLGNAFGGGAIGGAVADIGDLLGLGLNKKGATVGGLAGGLIGSFLGGPIGGAILGAVIGGVIKPKNPFADARITTTNAGVEASVYNQRGDGSAQTGMGIAGSVSQQLSQIANALGADIRSGLALGSIGFSGKDYYFNAGGGDYKGPGAQKFGSADEAVAAAVANALASNAVTSSPKVQAALARYAGNVNLAVSEALKVKAVEDLLDSSGNPFSAAIKAFERQAAQRLQVAQDYGLDVLAVERANADQRKKLIEQSLEQSIGSAKALLNELQYGSRATGSFGERRAALMTERDRLLGLANAGDNEAAQKLTDVLQQLLDVSSAGYGATDVFAADRSSTLSLLQQLVAQRQAQLDAAVTAAKQPDPQLTEANASLDDLVSISQRMAASLAELAAKGGATGGSSGLAELYARGLA
jgi:hypothetical protein